MQLCFAVLLMTVSSASQADLSETFVYRVLTTEIDTSPPEVVMLREFVTHKNLTTKAKAAAGKIAGPAIFGWFTEKVEAEFYAELNATASYMKTLDPSVLADRKKLEEYARVLGILNDTTRDFERALHRHANELIVLDAMRTGASYGPFAKFYIKRLPKLRRTVRTKLNAVKSRLKQQVDKKSLEEEYEDREAEVDSVKWAWSQVEYFSKLKDSNDTSKKAIAASVKQWAEKVILNLPNTTDRTKIEVAIYGAHQALVNTLATY